MKARYGITAERARLMEADSKQQTTNNKQQTTNNKQQTTNNKQTAAPRLQSKLGSFFSFGATRIGCIGIYIHRTQRAVGEWQLWINDSIGKIVHLL
ncbi:hypothetical protein [Paenibacillus sp. HB172176]|uniref:hypothetical protein n=1 Tax=Paenibacillus sp. HB172176 TaxID=2493690 RepID=UPI00143AEB88|nr:hypothetical protein [Paenibacillus sp. HB172176]